QDAANGRYEIHLAEVRHATPQELQAGRRQDVLRAHGVALLNSVIQTLGEVRSIQTRVRAQMQAAELLRTIDDSLVRRLVTDAAASVREYIERMTDTDQDDYYPYSVALQMRQQVLQFLGQFDPEAALDRKSTRLNSSHVSISYAV